MEITPQPLVFNQELVGHGLAQAAEGLSSSLQKALTNPTRDEAEIRRAAKELDGYFISYLMKTMRETVPQKGFLPNKGGEQFYYFYDMELGRLAAERGGLGFGAMMLDEYARQHPGGTKKNLSSSGADLPIQHVNR